MVEAIAGCLVGGLVCLYFGIFGNDRKSLSPLPPAMRVLSVIFGVLLLALGIAFLVKAVR